MNIQYNPPPDLRLAEGLGVPAWIDTIVKHINRQLVLVGRSLRGAVTYDAGESGIAKTVNPTIADITALELTDNVTLTLSLTDLRKGMSGSIEFTQDATGSRVVTFVNLLNAAPAITATANKRTLVLFTHVGDGWVATLLASNY